MGDTTRHGGATGATAAAGIADVGWAPELGGTSESGGSSELGETPAPRGLDGFDSGPPTPLPLLGRETPHHRRATPAAGNEGYGGEGERGAAVGEKLSAPDTTTAPLVFIRGR